MPMPIQIDLGNETILFDYYKYEHDYPTCFFSGLKQWKNETIKLHDITNEIYSLKEWNLLVSCMDFDVIGIDEYSFDEIIKVNKLAQTLCISNEFIEKTKLYIKDATILIHSLFNKTKKKNIFCQYIDKKISDTEKYHYILYVNNPTKSLYKKYFYQITWHSHCNACLYMQGYNTAETLNEILKKNDVWQYCKKLDYDTKNLYDMLLKHMTENESENPLLDISIFADNFDELCSYILFDLTITNIHAKCTEYNDHGHDVESKLVANKGYEKFVEYVVFLSKIKSEKLDDEKLKKIYKIAEQANELEMHVFDINFDCGFYLRKDPEYFEDIEDRLYCKNNYGLKLFAIKDSALELEIPDYF